MARCGGDPPVRFVCDMCGKRFQAEAIRKKHMITHSALRPFACGEAECFKTFKTEMALASHSRTHSGEKPHVCTVEGCLKVRRAGGSTSLSESRVARLTRM